MLVHAAGGVCLSARAPRIQPLNTVGAGDAMLAAVARQVVAGATPAGWLRHGVAAGTALTQCEAGVLPKL